MKQFKKLLALLLCLVMALTMITGCGKSDDDEKGNDQQETTTEAPQKNFFETISSLSDLESGVVSGEIELNSADIKTMAQTYLGTDTIKIKYEAYSDESSKNAAVKLSLEVDGKDAEAVEVAVTEGTIYVNATKLIDVITTVVNKIDATQAEQFATLKTVIGSDWISITQDDLKELLGSELDLDDLGGMLSGQQEEGGILGDIEGFENVTEEDILKWVTLAIEVGGEKTANALESAFTTEGTTAKFHIGADNAKAIETELINFTKNDLPGLLDEYTAKLKETCGETDALYQYLNKNLADIKKSIAEEEMETGSVESELDGAAFDVTIDVTGEKGSRTVALGMSVTDDSDVVKFSVNVQEGQKKEVTIPESATSFSELSALFGGSSAVNPDGDL